MKNNPILRWHLALLLLEHGESPVLGTLAELLHQTPDNLEHLLRDINKVGHARTKQAPTRKSSVSIDSLLTKYPDKAPFVRELKDRYDNHTLLPELKDVRQFLERHSQSAKTLRSRVNAAPKVIRVLIELPLHELETMLSVSPSQEFSALGVISDQILGRK